MNNLYYNNDLFDTSLIFSNFEKIRNFIKDGIKEENDLTFDLIDKLEQLIAPNYFSYLFNDINPLEIKYFEDYLKRTFKPPTKQELKQLQNDKDKLNKKKGNKEIQNLMAEIEDVKVPIETLIKWFFRMYSLESEFFVSLNKSLRKADKDAIYFYPFIKLCYQGIRQGFIESYYKEIYRASKISKSEFEIIKRRFDKKIDNDGNNIDKSFNKIIVFARSFLSFSMNKNATNNFKGADKDTFCILYIIEEIKDIENIKNKISNVIVGHISKFEKEQEVLVFPFTCFEIVNIKEIKNNKIDYEIYLKYLGNYSKLIKEQFDTNFFDRIEVSNFSQELIESGIIENLNFFLSWEKRKEIIINLDTIYFFLDAN